MTATLTVRRPGPRATVQDAGRAGLAHLGVPPAGACDRGAWALGNRLVGNRPDAAGIEATMGGLALTASADVLVAVTGARVPDVPHNAPFTLAAGAVLELGTPTSGLRTYVAVRGGLAVAPVLGSRSTDLLSGLGPPPLAAGDVLPLGAATAAPAVVDQAPAADPPTGTVTVRVSPGPRRDWFSDAAWERLTTRPYTVGGDSNRVGLRLTGPALERSRDGELPPEGLVRGAVQVPASGTPVVFLADHPVTGGYPVVAVVDHVDVDRCAQLRPGQQLRFAARP